MTLNGDLQKKRLIKSAARDLFFRFGFPKTSMEDIARQSGLAKPTLYYYYTNKQEIFNDIVIDEATCFMDEVEKKLPPDMPADERMSLFLRLLYKGLKKYASEMAKIPELMCEHSPHGKPIVDAINRLLTEKLQPLLVSGREEGIFNFDDESITAATLVVMVDFLNLDWMQRQPEKFRDQVVDRMIDIVINGLKRRD